MRVLNVARGPLIVDEDLQAALDCGKVAGAALDVFRAEPITDHPLFGYPNVIVTPHLGASTAEATDRAGYQAAEQVVAALTGGSVTSAVNVPAVAAEDLEVLGPFLPLAARSAASPSRSPDGSVDRVEVEFLGRIAERDTRPLDDRGAAGRARGPHRGGGQRGQRAVARRGARDRRRETKRTSARDFTDLVRVTVVTGERASAWSGTTLGRRHRPHLLEAWGQRFNLQLEDAPGAVPLPRRAGHDRPRRHAFGEHGREHRRRRRRLRRTTTDGAGAAASRSWSSRRDAPVRQDVVDEHRRRRRFVAGRAVALS